MGGAVEDLADTAMDFVTGGMIGGSTSLATGGKVSTTEMLTDAVTPDIPKIETPAVAELAEPATIDDSGARAAEEERRRRANARGRGSTVLTGSLGLPSGSANIGTATLLG